MELESGSEEMELGNEALNKRMMVMLPLDEVKLLIAHLQALIQG